MELIEGLSIGPYRLVGPAGAGGMAEVWRAYDVRLERYVAIKFLSPRYAADPDYVRRFLQEARAVSRLDHPNVLTIYDYGEHESWTYMVSPFIGGGTLAAQLRRGPWNVREAVEVLAPLAAAIDYAHGEGLVHRDVKPSNVLFTDQGRLILSDFGIARMVERSTMWSQTGLIIGTPMYMSPEQADGERATDASDRYSFGVVAYEMLTGRPPFLAETPMAMLLAHIQKPLPPPRTINPGLAEAAEAALFKILAKIPADRHASCAQFVEALRRGATAAPEIVASPLGGAPAPVEQSRLELAQEAPPASLTPPRPAPPVHPAPPVPSSNTPPPRPSTPGTPPPGTPPPSTRVSTPGAGIPAAGIPTTALPTATPPTPRIFATPPGGQGPRSPQGTRTVPLPEAGATPGVSRRKVLLGLGAAGVAGIGLMAYLLDVSPGSLAPATPTRAPSTPTPASAAKPAAPPTVAPAGAAPAAKPTVGTPVANPTSKPALTRATTDLPRVGSSIYSNLVFSPDGQTIACGGLDGDVQIVGFPNGNGVRVMKAHAQRVTSVALSPNGPLLISGSFDTTAKLWRVADGSEIRTLKFTGPVLSVAISRDAQTVATSTGDLKEFRLWRVSDGTEIRTLNGHERFVWQVEFAPDGKVLASCSEDNTIRLWNVADGQPLQTLGGHTGPVYSIAFSPDSQLLVSGSTDKTVKLWRVADGSLVRTLDPKAVDPVADSVFAVAFSPDGQTVAAGVTNVGTVIWRVADGGLIAAPRLDRAMQMFTRGGLAFAPDGRTIAVVGDGFGAITLLPLS